jgi:hypothetical protein
LLRDFKYSTSQPAKSTKAMALNYWFPFQRWSN